MSEKLNACRNCAGTSWVCENHRDYPWAGNTGGVECCGGAGAPCGACNLAMASAGYVNVAVAPYRAVLEQIAASAPVERPGGPYDPQGGYSSDNYGDVIVDAEDLCSWHYAERARKVLHHDA